MSLHRILCLTTSYPLEADSSSGVFVARLAEELNKSNTVTVLAPAYKTLGGKIPAVIDVYAFRYAPTQWQMLCHQPGGIPAALRRSRALVLLVPLLLAAMLLRSVWHARKCNVIQANWAVCGAIAAIAALFHDCKVVTTLRGDDVNKASTSFISRLFLKAAVAGSATVVTVSESLKQQLTQELQISPDKIAVIPNGVGDDFLALGRSKPNASGEQALSLITVGSLIPRKNVGFILRALPALPNECRLTVVGEGQLEADLRAQARDLGVAERVDFRGKTAPNDIPGLLAGHDIFVLASFSEGRSNAVYEAMAAGLTVVASDIPGTREQIDTERNGYLFDLNSTDNFVAIVDRLNADRSLLADAGQRAHQWVVDNNLSWEATAKHYTALFEAAAQR